MRLRHKNTSRWAKHALKQQKHNPALKHAVQEQISIGEELRKKQLALDADNADDSEGSDESDIEGFDAEGGEHEELEELEEGVAMRRAPGSDERHRTPALLWELKHEDEPAMPTKGLFSMAFMKRAAEKRRGEAAAMLKELEAQAPTCQNAAP